jgi:hypothetical protein
MREYAPGNIKNANPLLHIEELSSYMVYAL